MTVTTNYGGFNMALATAAHAGTSFTPDKRAQAEYQEFSDHIAAVREKFEAYAETDEQKEILKHEITRYRAGYLQKLNAYYASRGRVFSPMISGPSNFPTRRMEKRNATVQRRYEDLRDWQDRAIRAIKRTMEGAQTTEQVEDAEYTKLMKKVSSFIATMSKIDSGEWAYNRSCFVSNLTGMIRRSFDAGNRSAAQRAIRLLDKLQGEKLKKPGITKRHSIWKLLDEPAEVETTDEPTGEETIIEIPGIMAVKNYDEDRVQIIFDSIPDQETRTALKRMAWRWSPRNRAWQRKLTVNAVADAKYMINGWAKEGVA